MSFLIIDAQACGSSGRAFVEWISAGIRAISGILEEEKISYELCTVEDFIRRRENYADFNVFLISGMSSDAPLIAKACRIIRNYHRAKNKKLIIGGPITFDENYVLKALNADIAIIGEGERAFKLLLKNGLKECELPENPGEIESIAYKENGKILKNPSRGYLTKDELNSLHYSASVVNFYPFHNYASVCVEILRGCSNFKRAKKYHGKKCLESCNNCESENLEKRLKCPLNIPAGCGFCSVGELYGYPRSREHEKIVREIKSLIDNGITAISFLVPDPFDYKREELVAPYPLTDPEKPEPNYKEIEKLCEMIWSIPEVEKGECKVTIRDVKATLVTEKTAEIIKKYFPSSILGLGCESGSEKLCYELGRGYLPSAVKRAVEILNKHGIKPKINLIAGLPGQDDKTTRETLNFMEELKDKVLYYDVARFEALPKTAFESCKSDYGPVKDENTRKLLEKAGESQKRFLNMLAGEEWKVLIGVYDNSLLEENENLPLPENIPKRKFRELAKVVGYPVFHEKHLALAALVVRIKNIENLKNLKTGDIRKIRIKGVERIGFRVIPVGEIVE